MHPEVQRRAKRRHHQHTTVISTRAHAAIRPANTKCSLHPSVSRVDPMESKTENETRQREKRL